ncbi:MAG TPA: hypothetical protein VIE65_06670 [Methylobacter sp.]
MTLLPSEPLTVHHDIEAFASGIESLDTWLKRRAMKNQATGRHGLLSPAKIDVS